MSAASSTLLVRHDVSLDVSLLLRATATPIVVDNNYSTHRSQGHELSLPSGLTFQFRCPNNILEGEDLSVLAAQKVLTARRWTDHFG